MRGESQLDVDYRSVACIKHRREGLGGIFIYFFDYIEWAVKEAKEETEHENFEWDEHDEVRETSLFFFFSVFRFTPWLQRGMECIYYRLKLIKHEWREKKKARHVKWVCLIRRDSVHDANDKRQAAVELDPAQQLRLLSYTRYHIYWTKHNTQQPQFGQAQVAFRYFSVKCFFFHEISHTPNTVTVSSMKIAYKPQAAQKNRILNISKKKKICERDDAAESSEREYH